MKNRLESGSSSYAYRSGYWQKLDGLFSTKHGEFLIHSQQLSNPLPPDNVVRETGHASEESKYKIRQWKKFTLHPQKSFDIQVTPGRKLSWMI